MISGDNTVVADNGLNTPQYGNNRHDDDRLSQSWTTTPDLYLHDVIMALGTSFYVENYDPGPTNAIGCSGTATAADVST